MEKLYWSVDFEEIHCEDTIQYVIGGWAAAPGDREVTLSFLADGKPYPVERRTEERPDVQAAVSEVTTRTDLGFRLIIRDAEGLWTSCKECTLWLDDGRQRVKALEKTTQQVRELYHNLTITYKIDIVEQTEGLLTIQGWVLGMFHNETIRLVDEEGSEVPHELMRMIRTDVNKAYRVDKSEENAQCGFQIRIKRKEISCRTLHLQFSNHLTTREYVLDLQRFDYENSKRGKLKQLLAWERRGENVDFIREQGIKEFVRYIRRQLEPIYADYNLWLKDHTVSKRALRAQRKQRFPYEPRISVVIPLYNTPIAYLKEMLDSLLEQTYPHLELCLADGSSHEECGEFIRRQYPQEQRIRYRKLEQNLGISGNTNAALELATGDYIMLADHDDIVAPDALYELVKVLNQDPRPDIVYTDEDKVSMDGRNYHAPNFKSDFNPDLLRSVNYICHIFLVHRAIVDEAGGFRSEFDGAQDYDFILRCVERTERIAHIPKVLYHWRAHPDSTAGNPASKQYAVEAGCRALQEHYRRLQFSARVEPTEIFGIYRTIPEVQGKPMVSVIILNKDHIDDLETCISSIVEKTTWPNYEILVVENNSEHQETFDYYEQLRYDCVRVLYWKGEFNYATINNFAAHRAQGEYLLLLNNDIEVITPSWMEEMLGFCQRPDVGIVGAKLYYPDDTIQHAGVVIGMGGIAGHILCRADGKEYGYNARLVTTQDISAVTAACLMISKEDYTAVGGFDERYTVAFNDIDLCLKLRSRGKLVVFHPYAELYHYESKSRGLEDTPEKMERFRREVEYFQGKWRSLLQQGDPYYNVNLTLEEGDCSLKKSTEETDAKRII